MGEQEITRKLLECLKDARSKLTDGSLIDLGYLDEVINEADEHQHETPRRSAGTDQGNALTD